MSMKSVYFLLVTICLASSVNAQLPQLPFPFPFPLLFQPSPGMPRFPFPLPFQPSPGTPGIPGIPGFPGIPRFPFPLPFQPSPGTPGIPGIPGIPGMPRFPFPLPFQPSPGMPGFSGMNKCWSTMMDMPGCFAEIRQSIMTGKFGNIGPACCKAFLDAEANCTQNLPFKPFFPPTLKQQCSRTAGPPTTL